MKQFNNLPAKMVLDLALLSESEKNAAEKKLTTSFGVDYTQIGNYLNRCFSAKQKNAVVTVIEMGEEGSPICEFKCGSQTYNVAVPAECLAELKLSKKQSDEQLAKVKTIEFGGCSVHSFG